MTNRDIERIENFMTKYNQSMNDIFCILGVGVCRMAINLPENERIQQFLNDMDNYILNDLQENMEDDNDWVLHEV